MSGGVTYNLKLYTNFTMSLLFYNIYQKSYVRASIIIPNVRTEFHFNNAGENEIENIVSIFIEYLYSFPSIHKRMRTILTLFALTDTTNWFFEQSVLNAIVVDFQLLTKHHKKLRVYRT